MLLVALLTAGCAASPMPSNPAAQRSAAPSVSATSQPVASPVVGAAQGSPVPEGPPPANLAVLVDLFPATGGYDVSLVAYGLVAAMLPDALLA